MTYSRLMRLANGYAESKVLLIANELGVFTAIGRGGRTPDGLAKRCGTTREGMRLLLQALSGLGLLRLEAGLYWNTRLSLKFLDANSPFAVTNLLWLLNHHWSDWTGMRRAVQAGRPGWAPITRTADFQRRFALAMHERSHTLAPSIIRSLRLPQEATRFVDLGGGAGSYSIALAQRYPQLKGLVIDQSVAVARRLIMRERLSSRIKVRQGNLLRLPLAKGADLALVSNVLHDFCKRENLLILRRVHRAIRPGGKIFIVEYFLDGTNTLPADASVFSLLMYAFTGTGRSYAWGEVEAWLTKVGFGCFRRNAITRGIGTLQASEALISKSRPDLRQGTRGNHDTSADVYAQG